ncbi:hypothetical protein QOZ80_1BG0049990 [Eleusine coracana subsp. coracana]|nr:hypothetical protein QOZ80_1BG0049990 [Eleusine coracana subsp. coracana]
MDSAGSAKLVTALEAELSAKSSRIAELEARVSLLEAENARLREAQGKAPDLTGEDDPILGRLEEAPCAHKQTAAEKPGEAMGCDVIVLSDGEEGIAVDADKGRSPEVRVVTEESEEVERGSESNEGVARCDSNVSLEDDDVSVMPPRKKRSAARVVTSDSEDEDMGVCELGSGEGDDQEGVITCSRKRALHRASDSENEDVDAAAGVSGLKRASGLAATEMESEDEDDMIPISKVLKKIRKKRASDDDELGDAQGCSPPQTRRSARLVKKRQAAPQVLKFAEPKQYEGSEDDTEEDDDMDDFINDGDPSEDDGEPESFGASPVNEESSPELEESDIVTDYKEAIDCIGRKKKDRDWNLEGDMLAAFREKPELCLKAVCALYRKQTEDEQLEKSALFHNKRGFNHIHATRASFIAEFLLDGDPHGPLMKTVDDLEAHDQCALKYCQMIASHYSKQLFAIYQNEEDPYFHP